MSVHPRAGAIWLPVTITILIFLITLVALLVYSGNLEALTPGDREAKERRESNRGHNYTYQVLPPSPPPYAQCPICLGRGTFVPGQPGAQDVSALRRQLGQPPQPQIVCLTCSGTGRVRR
jgi:hypothetical protein